jgi:hypothetical protein
MGLTTQAVTANSLLRMLGNVERWLQKAEQHAGEKKFEMAVLLQSRLAPDMFPLETQVRVACQEAKRIVCGLLGETVPTPAGVALQTLEEVRKHIADSIAFVKERNTAALEDGLQNPIELAFLPEKPKFPAQALVTGLWMPNFFFHVSMTYAILRHNGVPIGKFDFIGGLN